MEEIEYILDETELEVKATISIDLVEFLQSIKHNSIDKLINEIEWEKNQMIKEHISESEEARRDTSRAGWNY